MNVKLELFRCRTVFILFVEIMRHILDSPNTYNDGDDEYWCVLFSVVQTTNGPEDTSETEWYEH